MKFAAKWVWLKNTVLRDVTQVQKDKHHVFSLSCGS